MTSSDADQPYRMPVVSGPGGTAQPLSTPPVVEGYEILRVLGEGGMGVVYLALQKQPIQRQVALKVIKAGMDSKRVIARFEAEEQALALLDHPNIAQVHDAGTTTDGHPCFCMEYVSGPPVTEYCDRLKLSIEERLRLFVQVCEGVQHAHQKGIIHRDLKPSNILISTEDSKPLPKIIDFGVAKALTAPLTERTLFTEQGQLLGTPEYMSPEQAEMSQHDIDTRSDVYSLGVVLYELLTGAPPFDRRSLELAGFMEILRTIREQDPARPSTRLSSLGAEARDVAESRKANPGLLPRQVRGDLDWIVMKSLEKSRIRRYGTAAELAADIRRHLKNEPVQAGPPTISYKLGKFIRRHETGVLAAALAVAALVVGSIMTTYGLLQARRDRDRAMEAERKAVIQQRETERQRNEATRNLYSAHMLIARQDWEDGCVVGLEELLDAHRPRPGERDLRGWEWYYLKTLCDQSLLTLYGHVGAVRSVAWSPDGHYVASAGNDCSVRIWDWLQAKPICVLEHTAPVRSIAWSPTGEQLASAGDDQTISIWEWAPGTRILVLRGHKGPIPAIAWSPSGQRIASGGKDSTVRIWSAVTGEELLSLSCESKPEFPLSVAWSPNGKSLVSGHRSMVTIWDVTTQKHRHIGDGNYQGNTWSVAWSPDNQLIASAVARLSINLWDPITGRKKAVLRDHKNRVYAATWSPDGQRLVSAGEDYTVKIWNPVTEKVLITLCGHKGPVYSVAWSPDGDLVASASEDGTVRIWDTTRIEEASASRRFSSRVISMDWSPDGRFLASACLRPEVQIWDPVTGEEVRTLRDPTDDSISCVAWSPDGKRLATGSQDKTIKVWRTSGELPVRALSGHKEQVISVSWSPDGERLASTSLDPNVMIWNAITGELVSSWHRGYLGKRGVKAPAVWSPDGRHLASPGDYGSIRIWDVNTGEIAYELRTEAADGWALAWSPHGCQLALGCDDGTIQIWELAEQRQVFSMRGHTDRVRAIAWSPDNQRIASASHDGTIKIWNATTGEVVLNLRGHEAEVCSVAWSPDGRRLASSSFDFTAKIWDASRGYELESGANLHTIWNAMRVDNLEEATQQLANFWASGNQQDWGFRQAAEAAAKALAGAYHRRGKATTSQGGSRYAEIIEDYHSALRIDPNCLPALNDLALLLATCPRTKFRNGTEAVRLATRVCELTRWQNCLYLSTLAGAYAEARDYEAAVNWQKQAILLLPDDKRVSLQRNYEHRLMQYEAGNDTSQWSAAMLAAIAEPVDPGTNGLVAHYAFEHDVNDSSGNRFHGIIVGVPSYVKGPIGCGMAMEFDGESYVNCGNDPSLDITDSFSISVWIRPGTDGSMETAAISKAETTTRWSWQLRYGWATDKPTIMGFKFNTTGGNLWIYVNQDLTMDRWYHVVGVYDGTTAKCYLDGVQADAAPMAGLRGGPSSLIFGSDGWGSHWIGAIDEVAIYDRALSTSEILYLSGVRAGVSEKDPSHVLYYSFDEVGETVVDQSGKNHDGTVNGNVTADPKGKYDRAANFAGGGYLDLSGPSFPVEDIPTSAMTITAWIKCRNTGDNHAIFSARASDRTWVAHPEVRSSGEFRWLLRPYGSYGVSAIFDIYAEGVRWNEWVHFAGTYDRESGKTALYIDGELARGKDVSHPAYIAGDWGLGARIGQTIDGTRPFTGLMDEFHLFTRALSVDEIRKVMQGP